MASRRRRQATRAAQRRRETVLHRLRVAGGITVGVAAVAGILYLLYPHGRHPHPDAARAAAAAAAPVAAAAPRAPSVPPPAAEAPPPRFDFYTMLPKLKVIVPGTDDADTPAPAAAPARSRAPARGAADDGGVYALQVGSFRDVADADRVKAQLALIGVEADIYSVKVDRDTWHRLMVGPFGSLHQLNKVALRLQRNNVDYIVMKVKG